MTKPGDQVWWAAGKPAVVTRLQGDDRVRIRTADGRTHVVQRKSVRPMHVPGAIRPLTATTGAVALAGLVREPVYGNAGHSPQPKDKPARSAAYLDFIRSKPCAICGATPRSEAAHWGGPGKSGGVGTKASDLLALPLCHECHSLQHQKGMGALMSDGDVYRVQRDLLAEWVVLRD